MLEKANQWLRNIGGDQKLVSRTGSGFLIRVLWALSSLALTFVGVRTLGGEEFGQFAIGITIALIMLAVLTFGQQVAVLRFIPQYRSQGRSTAAYEFFKWSWRRVLIFVFASTILGAIALLVWTVIINPIPENVALGAVFGIVMALATVSASHWRSEGSVFWALFPKEVAWRAILILVLPIAATAGMASASNALVVAIIFLSPIVFWQVLRINKKWSQRARDGEVATETDHSDWADASNVMWIGAVFSALNRHAGVLVVGFLLGGFEAGLYFAAMRVAHLVSFIMGATETVAAPIISELFHSGQRRRLQRTTLFLSLVAGGPALAVFLIISVVGTEILALMDEVYITGYQVLIVLALGQLINASAGPVLLLLNMTEHHRWALILNVGAATLQLVLSIALGLQFGIIGVAFAYAITAALRNGIAAVLVYHEIGVLSSVVGLFSPTLWQQGRDS